jgi:hypothetical protein
MPCTSSARSGGAHPGAASSAVAPRGKSLTPLTSTTTPTNCPKRKKFNSSNKYDYANRNDSSNKGDGENKNCFRDNNKKKF